MMGDAQMGKIAPMRGWAKDWYGMDIADPVTELDRMMGPHQQGASDLA